MRTQSCFPAIFSSLPQKYMKLLLLSPGVGVSIGTGNGMAVDVTLESFTLKFPLMWMLPLYLHIVINQISSDDDDHHHHHGAVR